MQARQEKVKKINYFVLRNDPKELGDFLSVLAELGIDNKFINRHNSNLYISLDGTLLTAELTDSGGLHHFELKYKDQVLCTTSVYPDGSYFQSNIKLLHGLPGWLLKENAEDEQKPLPVKLFFIGCDKPSVLQMQHLHYIGIKPEHLIRIGKYYYLKLPQNAELTTSEYIDTDHKKRRKLIRYNLHYKGALVLVTEKSPREFYFECLIHPEWISEAIQSIDNILKLPTYIVTSSKPGELKRYVFGTIDGCAEGIRTNLYDGYQSADFSFSNYVSNNLKHESFSILVDALKSNKSLKSIKLFIEKITFQQLMTFAQILIKHPKHPSVFMEGCRFDMDKEEFEKVLPYLAKIDITMLYTRTRDNFDPSSLLKAYKMKKQTERAEIEALGKRREKDVFNRSDKKPGDNMQPGTRGCSIV